MDPFSTPWKGANGLISYHKFNYGCQSCFGKNLVFSCEWISNEQSKWNNQFQKQPTEVFYKEAVLKNFDIFIGKQLYWSLFLIKFFGLEAESYFEEHLQIAA